MEIVRFLKNLWGKGTHYNKYPISDRSHMGNVRENVKCIFHLKKCLQKTKYTPIYHCKPHFFLLVRRV